MKLGWIYVGNRHHWRYCWVMREWFGVFRNRPGVVGGRWGFYVMALEFGNRNPRQQEVEP